MKLLLCTTVIVFVKANDYLYSRDSSNTLQPYANGWLDAQTKCRNYAPGWDLVSIDSAVEQQTVMTELQKVSVWEWVFIGVNDHQTESTIVWSDNTPFGSYVNWLADYPNNGWRDYGLLCNHQGHSWYGQWLLWAGTANRGYVCELNNPCANAHQPTGLLCLNGEMKQCSNGQMYHIGCGQGTDCQQHENIHNGLPLCNHVAATAPHPCLDPAENGQAFCQNNDRYVCTNGSPLDSPCAEGTHCNNGNCVTN